MSLKGQQETLAPQQFDTSSARARSRLALHQKQKDRLAAISQKSDQVFQSVGWGPNRFLFRRNTYKTETNEASEGIQTRTATVRN
jgi:hypothetical protein